MKKGIKLIFIILCMVTIFMFSSDDSTKSTKKSDGVIIHISNLFSKSHLSREQQEKLIDDFVVPVRKSAHFFIYMILGILLVSFIREFSLATQKTVFLAIFLAFLYACSDEVHQLFVPGRSGQFKDVLLDTLGASVGVFIYQLISKIQFKKKNI